MVDFKWDWQKFWTTEVDVSEMAFRFYMLQSISASLQNKGGFQHSLLCFKEDIKSEMKQLEAEIEFNLRHYIIVAVAGELRHAFHYLDHGRGNKIARKKLKELLKDFGLRDSRRKINQRKVSVKINSKNVIQFLENSSQIFNASWSTRYPSGGAFGGKAWYRISQHLLSYLSGKINCTVFIDTAFSLEHHGGNFLDKCYMWDFQSLKLKWVFLLQSKSEDFVNFYNEVKKSKKYLYEFAFIERYYNRGKNVGVWKRNLFTGRASRTHRDSSPG